MLKSRMAAEEIKKARKRKKLHQEDHYDDCGSDCCPLGHSCHWSAVLGADGSLGAAIDYCFGEAQELCSTPAESSGDGDVGILSSNFFSLNGSSGGTEGHQGRLCCFEEFVGTLSRPAVAGYLDLCEIYDGEGGVRNISIRRRLKTREKFDLRTGFDLAKSADQRLVIKYLNDHKPFVVILAPLCTSFGFWSHLNRVLHPATWSDTRRVGELLVTFAARVVRL